MSGNRRFTPALQQSAQQAKGKGKGRGNAQQAKGKGKGRGAHPQPVQPELITQGNRQGIFGNEMSSRYPGRGRAGDHSRYASGSPYDHGNAQCHQSASSRGKQQPARLKPNTDIRQEKPDVKEAFVAAWSKYVADQDQQFDNVLFQLMDLQNGHVKAGELLTTSPLVGFHRAAKGGAVADASAQGGKRDVGQTAARSRYDCPGANLKKTSAPPPNQNQSIESLLSESSQQKARLQALFQKAAVLQLWQEESDYEIDQKCPSAGHHASWRRR